MRTGSRGQRGRLGGQRGRPRVEIGVGRQGGADGCCEVCVQEVRRAGVGAGMNEGGGRGRGRCREKLELRVLIVVARAAGRAGAVEEALASEKIGLVGPPGICTTRY